MQKEALITIIVPIYKVENYLEKCIDSILSQTYKNLEIFLVDDGSPDTCGEIAEHYAKKDSRIIVIHKENGGLSDARNVAVDIAKGEYISFIDSDDYVTKDYIEVLYNLIQKNQCKISASGFLRFKEKDNVIENNLDVKEELFSPEEAINTMFYQKKFDTSAWAKLYHTSLFQDGIRYPKGLLYEDLATTYKLFLKSDKIAFSNKKTYFYLIRETSIEGSAFSPNKIDSTLKIINQLEVDFYNLPQFKKSLQTRLFNFCFHVLISMPFEYQGRSVLIDVVKKNRLEVLFNKNAKIKSRIISLMSYLGINNIIRIIKTSK